MDRRPSGGDLRHSGDEQCSTSRRQYAWRRRPIARRKTASAHDRSPGKIVGVSKQGAAVSNRRFVKRRSGERRSLIGPRSSLPFSLGEKARMRAASARFTTRPALSARVRATESSSRDKRKCAIAVPKASPRDCFRPSHDLRPSEIARVRRSRRHPGQSLSRQCNCPVPSKNNFDVRRALAVSHISGQKINRAGLSIILAKIAASFCSFAGKLA